MINDTPDPISELPPVNPFVEPFMPKGESSAIMQDVIPSQYHGLKRSNKKLWTIIGIAFGLFACCCLVGVTAVVFTSININREKGPIENVLDSHMYAMAIKNAESAYALFSPRAKRQISLSKIQELLEGNNFVLFEGYESLSVSTLRISAAVNSNPNSPQGTIAIVSGTISYKNGFEGTFNGTLEKEDNKWQIYNMSVSVPPDKFK